MRDSHACLGRAIALAGALLGLPALALAEPPREACAETRMAPSGTAWLEVASRDRGDAVARSRARLSWSEGEGELRLRLQMLEPAEVAGSAVLLVERSDGAGGAGDPVAWAYLPELEMVRKVGGRHLRKPLFGTNLSYEDLDRVRHLADGAEAESWSETRQSGRPVWRIDAQEGRQRLTTWLDRERCVPVRAEVTDRRGRVARLLQVSTDPASPEPQAFLPSHFVVRDVLGDSSTEVRIEAVDLVAAPAETLFDPAFLGAEADVAPPPASPATP